MGSIQPPSTKVLVLGGSYGGLSTALNLLRLCRGTRNDTNIKSDEVESQILDVEIKIVDERDGYYHLIGSPLALASPEYASKAWQRYEDIPAFKSRGLSFTQGSAVSVNPETKTAVIKNSLLGVESEEKYDILVVATGLRRVWPVVPQSLKKKEYLLEAGRHISQTKNARDGVVVVGGGAVGIEMAAEIKVVHPTQKVTLIHSRPKLLSSEPLPDDFKDRTLQAVHEVGVETVMGQRVMDITSLSPVDGSPRYELLLSDGSRFKAGLVISAISRSEPSTSFLPKEALDKDGYVKITSRVHFDPETSLPNPEHHFAVGDIAAWSGIKRCGAALHMGNAAAVNIHQLLLQAHHASSFPSDHFPALNQIPETNLEVKQVKAKFEPKFQEWPEIPPMIAIAIGKQAAMWGEEDGTKCGEEEMQLMFQNDLGWQICWDFLGLGEVVA